MWLLSYSLIFRWATPDSGVRIEPVGLRVCKTTFRFCKETGALYTKIYIRMNTDMDRLKTDIRQR